MRNFFLACTLFFCANVLYAVEEAEIKKLLPGTWIISAEADGLMQSGEMIYKPDGTFTGSASLNFAGEKIKIDIEGKWTVKGDSLECHVTKTSSILLMPVGTITKDKILEINDKIIKYRDEEGDVQIETRKKE